MIDKGPAEVVPTNHRGPQGLRYMLLLNNSPTVPHSPDLDAGPSISSRPLSGDPGGGQENPPE